MAWGGTIIQVGLEQTLGGQNAAIIRVASWAIIKVRLVALGQIWQQPRKRK